MNSKALARPVMTIGMWSAVIVAVSCIVFTIGAVLAEADALAAPWDLILPIAPSLTLAPAFLAMMVCLNATIEGERKIWSQLGVAFATVYVPLCASAYIIELFVVEPLVMQGAGAQASLLTLTHGGTVLNAVDGLGYIFMSLATLCAAPALVGDRLQNWIRGLFIANGIVAVPIFLTYFVSPSFLYLAALWSITISASSILLALHFGRAGTVARVAMAAV